MKLSFSALTKCWFYLFPLLIALYPIIFLYSHNVQELLLPQLFTPVTIAIIVTIVCWVGLSFFIRDVLKAGIIVTIFIFFFYTYGFIFDSLVSLNLFTIKHRHILPALLFIAGYLAYFSYFIRTREILENSAKILTVIVSVMLFLSIVTVIPQELKKIEYSQQDSKIAGNAGVINQSPGNGTSNYPDIYYIILDEYARSSTIKEIWGYDNSKFEDFLMEKGFFIASNSSVRKADTLFSISSNLNMEYVDENTDTLTLFSKINDNKVMNFLKDHGYSTIVIDGIKVSYPAKGNITADYDYSFDNGWDRTNKTIWLRDDFSNVIIQTTMLKTLSYKFEHTIQRGQFLLYTFEKSRSIDNIVSPKFVYIHINSPHVPFVFDAEGNNINPENAYNLKAKKYYLGQYIFTTNQIQQTVDVLLKNKEKSTIIVIQSDHGPRSNPDSPIPEENLEIPQEESVKILNAFYFPDSSKKNLYSNISPVNTFRFIFNHTFHEDIQLLEDV